MKANYFLKVLSTTLFFIYIIQYLFVTGEIKAQHFSKQEFEQSTLKKPKLQKEFIGGVIDKSDLKVGFFNNGRFCADREYRRDLPSAVYGDFGYLRRLDLWVGVPEGPWTPKVWDADSQKYISQGPTVSGTIYEPVPTGTDWATIAASEGVFYTKALLYSDVYKPSELFDFILAPHSEYEVTWPRNPFTGFREWPGQWQKDPQTGEPIEGRFLGAQDIFLFFDDKSLSDQYYPEQTIRYWNRPIEPQKGYPLGLEVFAEAIGFGKSSVSNIVIFDLKIVNTSDWDYHDVYLGLYYESDNPVYSVQPRYLQYSGLRTKYIKNEYAAEEKRVFPYNLSYNHSRTDEPSTDHNYFGVQILKTPLAEDDNIDNDGDGLVDEPEGEELGLTGWHYFPPPNMIEHFDRERFQYQILSGDTTGLSKLIDGRCFFKDINGNLDPNFDFPGRIFDNRWWALPRGYVWFVYDVLSCGPINLAKGDTLNFVFGIMVAEDLEKIEKDGANRQKNCG